MTHEPEPAEVNQEVVMGGEIAATKQVVRNHALEKHMIETGELERCQSGILRANDKQLAQIETSFRQSFSLPPQLSWLSWLFSEVFTLVLSRIRSREPLPKQGMKRVCWLCVSIFDLCVQYNLYLHVYRYAAVNFSVMYKRLYPEQQMRSRLCSAAHIVRRTENSMPLWP